MSKVNGNDGNNKDLMQGLQAYYEALRANALGKNSETKEAKGNVPVGQPTNVEHKELGDELLTMSFYPDVQFSTKVKNTRLGSLNDLTQTLNTFSLSKADRADKKAVYNAIEGNDWSSYLTRAYTYGTLNENSMKNIASVDFSEENMPEYIADDLNAEVVIA